MATFAECARTEEHDSSSASSTALFQLNTNTTNLTHTDPPTMSPYQSVSSDGDNSIVKNEIGQSSASIFSTRKEKIENFIKKGHEVSILEESKMFDSGSEKKVKFVDKEMKIIQREMKELFNETGVRTIEKSMDKTFKEVIKASENKTQAYKPPSMVLGAVPLFKSSEDIVTKTNAMLHKELKSKIPSTTKPVARKESKPLQKFLDSFEGKIKESSAVSYIKQKQDHSVKSLTQKNQVPEPVWCKEMFGMDGYQKGGKIL